MNNIKEAIRFLIIGGISTTIDFLLYIFLYKVERFDIVLAKICSMLAASLFSYFLNKKWTFQNKKKKSLEMLLKYYGVFTTNVIVNVSINKLLFSLTKSIRIAFVVATGIATIVNYVMQKYIVFYKIRL